MAYCVFYLGWAGSTCVAARLLPPWAAAARAAAAAAFSISVMAYAAPLPLLGLLLLRCCCRCSFSIRRDSLLACLLLLARLLALLRVRELCEAEIDLGTLSWSRRCCTFACGCKWLGQRRRRRQAGTRPTGSAGCRFVGPESTCWCLVGPSPATVLFGTASRCFHAAAAAAPSASGVMAYSLGRSLALLRVQELSRGRD